MKILYVNGDEYAAMYVEDDLGVDKNEYMICETCRGSGEVDVYNNQLDEVIPEVCPDCKGKGYFE